MTRITKLSQPESVADFKLRLAALMRGLKPDAAVGAACFARGLNKAHARNDQPQP